MNKAFYSWLISSGVLFVLTVLVTTIINWAFPNFGKLYFNLNSAELNIYYFGYLIHPFIISFSLCWFWNHCKDAFDGWRLPRCIEFSIGYVAIAMTPLLWMIYCTMDVSLSSLLILATSGLFQGIIAELIFERVNP